VAKKKRKAVKRANVLETEQVKQGSPPEPAPGPREDANGDDPKRNPLQRNLVKAIIALPLFDKINEDNDREFDVIIDVHLDYPGGRAKGRDWLLAALAALLGADQNTDPRLKPAKNAGQPQYIFARLNGNILRQLVAWDGMAEKMPKGVKPAPGQKKLPTKEMPSSWTGHAARAIYQIWEDFQIRALISTSISTVKADAARAAFKASGRDIVWAVVDSGIDAKHPHFQHHGNLKGVVEGWHRDYTGANAGDEKSAANALTDAYGHGTHVAGIIAGEILPVGTAGKPNPKIMAYRRILEGDAENGEREIVTQPIPIETICGMAPRAGLVSLKVLDENGRGNVSNIIAALTWIQEINGYGRRIRIHGVNLSVGYPFDAEWFACGQSQLCVEVDRLVRSGVVVVVAAGNAGYGTISADSIGGRKGGLPQTIDDPGNADLAITVGATHREMPHVYGVSYFSGKGPTGDGRLKPDVVAPGEKVISCGTGQLLTNLQAKLPDGSSKPNYIEYTGTSMAAPHVSGCVASFLSVKREFIGRPERVKEVFMATATDLGRDRTFQGSGLVDLMRAIQHV
jgi:subtilisin family serine protease